MGSNNRVEEGEGDEGSRRGNSLSPDVVYCAILQCV